ncbi:hypothetical protein HY995_00365 [Candidatus Micrarchaeota archaeon]|nr:hypothetical protein [Candidatus Micrarchaeota archaeon]
MPSSLNIAVLGENAQSRERAASSLGKKAGVDDLGFYHTVFQGKIVSAIDPAAYPAKLSTLTQALALCDYALVVADAPSPPLGEIIVALDLLNSHETAFCGAIDFTPFLSNTAHLKESKVFADPNEAKQFLLEKENPNLEGPAKILVDHCFEVKGVGTVALGVVKRGEVKIHDSLTSFPSGQPVEIRTIQKNNQDAKDARCGDRVGLSIKGLKAGDVPRGAVFAKGEIGTRSEIKCVVALSKFRKNPLKSGETLHLAAGLQFEPCRIELGAGDAEAEIKPDSSALATLKCEKPIAFENGEKMLLCNLNAKGLRAIAVVTARLP